MNTLFKPTHIHSKLDGSWLYLHEQMPPQKWAALPSFGAAATWLDYLSREYQQGRLRWPDYRSRLLHAAELHYGHLHGHHRLEDTHHFPQMRKLEPKLARGFDVLDADHHHIEQQLYRIQTLLAALQQNEAANPALADKLAQAIEAGGGALYRHLADEEDLVIPILALRAE